MRQGLYIDGTTSCSAYRSTELSSTNSICADTSSGTVQTELILSVMYVTTTSRRMPATKTTAILKDFIQTSGTVGQLWTLLLSLHGGQ